MLEKIKEELKEYVKEKYLSKNNAERLVDNTKLIDDGIIDSSAVLSLIMQIEDKYNIEFLDEELIPENFNTVNDLSNIIVEKLDKSEVSV